MEYFLAIIVGVSLGLLGGGGSILTVPIFVYILNFEAKTAIALSLAVVGLSSLVGSYTHWKNKNINFKVALAFGPIAMIGTYFGAYISRYMSDATQLILFAIIMLLASIFMFKSKNYENTNVKPNYILLSAEGLVVGVITGIVGVGGGFLIVPALVLLGGLPMKIAIGTSLLLISLKSFSGFAGYVNQIQVPWDFLFQFSIVTAIGIVLGTKLSNYLSAQKLKKIFAVFLLLMAIFILYKNLAILSNLF